MAPVPYRIDVAEVTLEDLRERLVRTRWPEPPAGSPWEHGTDIAYLRELCEYWRSGFDWRAQERRLNAHPQFISEIDGVALHYWHVRAGEPEAFPLLLVHGWPGSMFEFLELIEPLRDHGFDLVIPALPGFGFGGVPRERGWGAGRVTAAFHTLMVSELGYRRYGVQGGDWGAIVAAQMAARYPAQVVAIHLNMAYVTPAGEKLMDAAQRAELQRFRDQESGYSQLQRSKPDTVTVGQADSPAGLAAWIVEKFRTWGDCRGDIESAFSKDTLLTNLMFYWAPNAAASAARIYYESQREAASIIRRIEVPTAIAAFPAEPFQRPRALVEACFDVRRWTDMPRGGHFAALEQPELLIGDIIEFFGDTVPGA